jgi:serine/threonine-protein kinase
MSEVLDRLRAALADRYRVERELGFGGMATVYLADDLKHNRRVAIKVLKPDLAAAVGKDRFFAEIETTAQLQHPNILPLFDSGEADGLLFYAMPFVEGETLGDRLKREVQLPVDQALDLIRKVASALDYAHQRGVVHRDIKPANILLSSGEPLVADFGIALAVSKAGEGRITQTGLSMGTPHYMSPEQASGDRSLDPRSDIYALGAVLYEMLTGDPPFSGSSAQAVLARILTSQATRSAVHRPTVPPHVDAAIARALEKIPADRFDTAGDFRKALDDPSFRHTTVTHIESVGALPVAVRRPLGPLVPVLGGLLAAVTAVAAWGWLRSSPAPQVQTFQFELDAANPGGRSIVLSPDGSRIVYVGSGGQLFERPVAALEGRPIPGARPARSPFFSPDGTSVGLNLGVGDDRFATVALEGGTPISLGEQPGVSVWGTWSEDGFIYFVSDAGGRNRLFRVPEQGGTPEEVKTEAAIFVPSAMLGFPDRLLVTANFPGQNEVVGIGLLDPQTGVATPIPGLAQAFDPTYAGGFLFWVNSEGLLVAARLDPGRGALTSPLVTLAAGLDGPGGYTVSQTGTLIYQALSLGEGGAAGGETVGWVTHSGETEVIDDRLAADVGDFDDVRLSPDGRYLALEVQRGGPDRSEAEEHRILIYDLEQGTSYQLTFEGRFNLKPRWMPDGRVAYLSDQGGSSGLWAQPFDRSGSPELIRSFDQPIQDFDVGPVPGAPLAVTLGPGQGPGTLEQGLYLVTEGDEGTRPLVATPFSEAGAAISPQGDWIAYVSDESGRDEVYVRAFPEGGRPYPISTEWSAAPVWAPNGEEIFFVVEAGLTAAQLSTESGVVVRARSVLFSLGRFELLSDNGAQYDVGPDGRLLTIFEPYADARAHGGPVVVLNVFEELRRRLGESGR